MRISDWSSDVCSSDLDESGATRHGAAPCIAAANEPTAGYCRCRAVPGVRCVQLHNWADFVGGWRHCPPHALCGRRTRDDGCGHRELTNAGPGQALLKLVPPPLPHRFDGHPEQALPPKIGQGPERETV